MQEKRRTHEWDLAGSDDSREAYPTTASEVEADEESVWPVSDELDLAGEEPTGGGEIQVESSKVHLDFRIGNLVHVSFRLNQQGSYVCGAGAYFLIALLAIAAALIAPGSILAVDAGDPARVWVAVGFGAVVLGCGCGWLEYRSHRLAVPQEKGPQR
jgi:hypothetical protein